MGRRGITTRTPKTTGCQSLRCVLVLQVATPVAVTNYMIAQKYGADAQEVAGLVVVSTLLAVLSIPAILAFFI